MEFVYVVPRRELFPERYPQGFYGLGSEAREAPVDGLEFLDEARFRAAVRRHGFFVERDHAEGNPELKQVIPYTLIQRGEEILLLKRLSRGGESRLHDKLTIGVGGHINPVDAEGGESGNTPGATSATRIDPIPAATHRELGEELFIEGDLELRPVGIVNDDSNAVGAVHVGLVQVARVEGDVRIRETDVLEGGFVTPERLCAELAQGANFETWSARIVEHLQAVLARPTALQP